MRTIDQIGPSRKGIEMNDYGHDLLFGIFITPHNRRPSDVVALAQLSERIGLDLVTFQDHPYQTGFLDTWTLLSWVAAQTQTISVSGNVLNLPLRPPAVLARAAASLDLLSGGRVELGLGGGGFWDAIEAMGGPRRSPGETVEALSEAIDVIRAIWDEQPGGVFLDGKHTASTALSVDPPRRMTSRSGSARTDHGCFGWSGRRPTAGCRALRICGPATSSAATASSTTPRRSPAAIPERYGGC